MDISELAPEIQKYIHLLITRKVISKDSLGDKMFINYLSSQMIDSDFVSEHFESDDGL